MTTEIWVDGSFTNDTPSWAILVKQDGTEVHRASGQIDDPTMKRYHQVIGELTAAKEAIKWCADNKVTDVSIFYDYEGIRSWALNAWKANNPVTKEYANYAQLATKTMNINFVKVKAHSGNADNNAVDRLAKLHTAVGITEIEDGIILSYKTKPYIINFKEMTIKNGD
jgi:ribonuclease HI